MTQPEANPALQAATADLKSLIQDLHRGLDPEVARERFDHLIRGVSPGQIGAMEETLIREGTPVGEIQRLCDVHVAVLRGGLERQPPVSAPPGHPVHTYLAENEIITRLAERLGGMASDPGLRSGVPAAELAKLLDELGGIHNHYLRKENQLFPFLERHGVNGPPKVMWGVHDEIRALLKDVRAGASSAGVEAGPSASGADLGGRLAALARSVAEMVFKENRILLPLALQRLTPGEWVEVRKGEDELGYAFAAPAAPWPSAPGSLEHAAPGSASAGASASPGRSLPLPIVSRQAPEPLPAVQGEAYLELGTGRLSLEQVDMLLRHLPVDISFVDAEGFVRYYSETPERIFPRTPGAIGRHVENCHPPKSVHRVKEILRAFAAGEREVAEFWIQMQGKFIHIRYFAVRNPAGSYLGCLEVGQDVTGIRALEGQQRLLEWSGGESVRPAPGSSPGAS